MSQGNNVRGPASALTEFLRDSGITPTTVAARVATRTQNQDQQAAGPSTTRTTQTSTRRRRASTRATGYASDNLDDPEEANAMDIDEEEKNASSSKKRKPSKAAEEKLKAKEKKKRGKKDSDDEYEDAYTALSKSVWASNTPRPPVGNFEICATCEKQFTVTKYTIASSTGEGFLCHQCAKAGGNDPFKKPAAPRKRKGATEKRKVTSFQERRFPTLVSLCIQLISEHIDDVEALGDIGTLNREAIAKALSKNRSLTPENAQLFYSATNTTLTLFDVTNLDSSALQTLAYHNANLVSLRLDFCGQLADDTLKVWATGLPALTRLELLGPFLVHSKVWQEFFVAHPKLEGFLITQSPRFDVDCIKSLVTHCPGIKELRLSEVGQMKDAFLHEIARLRRGVRLLDLSDPSESCSEAAMIDLISAIGKSLTHLCLSKHDLLTDTFLSKGLRRTMHLESLTLSHLPELTDGGVAGFFEVWKNPTLLSLDMSGNVNLASGALQAILKHSGRGLERLNINGWKDVGNDDLVLIGRTSAELKKLDVGWCRAVDDFVLQGWLHGKDDKGVVSGGCKRLQEVKVWGCNKVSATCSRRPGVMILGMESHTVL